jgi:dihydrodipicolinate synthase/N-acetylneuraminate lyase
MAELQIDGVVPIIPTPFLQDGSPDWSSLTNLLDFAAGAQVCAVCLPAYASEFYKLTDDERRDLALRAIGIMQGRLPVIAQVNHVSTTYVIETARELESAGASAISVAVPRLFNLPERDLLRYFDRILSSIAIPLVIQDFNPTGATVSLDFLQRLRRQHPHFRYLKLEEPLMSERVRAIIDGTSGQLGLLEGWGGVYMIELFKAGIVGIMPGLAVADVLQLVWNRLRRGDRDGAYSAFVGVLPQITYSLQNLEFFHHAEKALLAARGVLPDAIVRDATMIVGENDRQHIDFLNRKVMEKLDELGLPKRPGMSNANASLESLDHTGV